MNGAFSIALDMPRARPLAASANNTRSSSLRPATFRSFSLCLRPARCTFCSVPTKMQRRPQLRSKRAANKRVSQSRVAQWRLGRDLGRFCLSQPFPSKTTLRTTCQPMQVAAHASLLKAHKCSSKNLCQCLPGSHNDTCTTMLLVGYVILEAPSCMFGPDSGGICAVALHSSTCKAVHSGCSSCPQADSRSARFMFANLLGPPPLVCLRVFSLLQL